MCTISFQWLATAILAVSLLGGANAARALTYLEISDGALADQATAIAEIDVLSKLPAPGTALPSTEYVVLVERVLKGSLEATETIRVLGGELDDGVRFVVPGAPVFREGERALVFLSRERDGTLSILHFTLGAFHRVETDDATTLAVRDLGAAFVAGKGVQRLADSERDYDRFATWLRNRARGARGAGAYMRPVAPDTSRAIVERFRLFGEDGINYRWFEFDGGGSVGWTFNGDRSGNPARDRDAFLQAMAAWNDDASSNVNYAFLGDGPADNFPSSNGRNGVTFGDPFNKIEGSFDCSTGGTLAIGGVLTDGSIGRFGGRSYLRILEGGIVIQDGIDCALQTDASLIAEVLAHEIGHTLGIDHSCGDRAHCSQPLLDDAAMRSMAHDDGRGARLNDDDRSAAAALYPSLAPGAGGGGGGGFGFTAPSGVTATAVSPTEVLVTWQDNSEGERRFRVQYAVRRRFFDAGVVGPNITELLKGNLTQGSTVRFRVRAEQRGAATSWSEVVTVTLP